MIRRVMQIEVRTKEDLDWLEEHEAHITIRDPKTGHELIQWSGEHKEVWLP